MFTHVLPTDDLSLQSMFVSFAKNPATPSSSLHNASTNKIDAKVREYAIALEDTALLAKLSGGDMIAIEAKYHQSCLLSFYNKARQAASKNKDGDEDCSLHRIAFAQLVAYVEDMNSDENSAPVFKMTDIAKVYKTRKEHLDVSVGNRIHTIRLKNRLLLEITHLMAYSQGRETQLLRNLTMMPCT